MVDLTNGEHDAPYYPEVGEKVILRLPASEVCLHMGVAGKRMPVSLLKSPRGIFSCQIWHEDGERMFSAPVTPYEAGFLRDRNSRWYVDAVGQYLYRCLAEKRTAEAKALAKRDRAFAALILSAESSALGTESAPGVDGAAAQGRYRA